MEAPAEGCVYTLVNRRQIQIAKAEYWVEDGLVTVRSREFDCFATGDSLDEAVAKFGRAVLDYADTLQEREDKGEATETERENLKALSSRLSRIYLEERHSNRRRRRRIWLRRGGRHDDRKLGPVPA